MWDWAKENHPKLFNHLSAESASADMMRTSKAELDTHLAPEITYALTPLSDLRNSIAHPSKLSDLPAYDRMAQIEETLIAAVGDGARLRQVVEARDALREEANREATELEEREMVAEIQGDHDGEGIFVWESEHVTLFQTLLRLPKGYLDGLRATHPTLVKAVERLADKNIYPKEINPLSDDGPLEYGQGIEVRV